MVSCVALFIIAVSDRYSRRWTTDQTRPIRSCMFVAVGSLPIMHEGSEGSVRSLWRRITENGKKFRFEM